jgi:LEA14-like dessication related protein
VNRLIHLVPVLLVPVLALIALGCSSQPSFQKPTVEVTGIRVDQTTPQGVRLIATLKLENPNDLPLSLKDSRYTIRIEGVGSFSDSEQSERTLPAKGSQTVELPAAIATQGGAAAGGAYSVTGRVNYEPPGAWRQILNDLSYPLPSVGFQSSGKLP